MGVFARLDELSRTKGLEFLVIGGHAVNAHGYSRITKDSDVLVRRPDLGQWRRSLEMDGYVVEHEQETFIQFTTPLKGIEGLDMMMVSETTFAQMKAAAKPVQIQNLSLFVPALDHLLALKLHALKYGPQPRGYKDLMDILTLIEVNKIDIRGDKFRALCNKYGDAKIYERLIAIEQS